MEFQNNAALKQWLLEGGYPELAEKDRFQMDGEEFLAAYHEVSSQHPELDHSQAQARAAYRLLAKPKSSQQSTVDSQQSKALSTVNCRLWTFLQVIWALLVLLLLGAIAARAQGGPFVQVQNGGTQIKLWAAGIARLNCSTNMTCTFNSGTGAVDMTAGAGGAVAWSGITAPTANLSLSHGANTTTFTWGAATGAGVNLFSFTDTLNNTGTGILVRHFTASGSALTPWQADANGNGVKVSTTGLLTKVGTGAIDAAALSGIVPKANLPTTTVFTDQANTYTAGMKQTFQNSATTAGVNLASSADPSTVAQGDIWLNTDDVKWRGSSAAQTAARSNGGGTSNTITKFIGANTIANGGATDDGTTFTITDTAFKVPIAAGAAPTANGDVRFDSTQTAFAAGGEGAITGHLPRVLASCFCNSTACACVGTGATAGTFTNNCVSGGADASCTNAGTTETNFGMNFSIPANFFIASKVLRVTIGIKQTATATVPTFTFRMKLGTTNVYTSAALAPAAAAVRGAIGNFILQGTAAPGARGSLVPRMG